MASKSLSIILPVDIHYERSLHVVENLAKEEECRRTRTKNLTLQKRILGLNENISEESESRKAAELNTQRWQTSSDEMAQKCETIMNELRAKSRELENLRAELSSLHSVSADSTKLLSEKLVLAAELSNLKPEVEHLRRQMSSHEQILSDKLTLQREVSNVRAELDNERKTLQSAKTRHDKEAENISLQQKIIHDLKAELAKEHSDRQKAEASSKAEHGDTVKQLQLQLDHSKRELEQAQQSSSRVADKALRELEKELEKERKDREKAERQVNKVEADFEAKIGLLEDKLDQFRTKLRSTKEKLKETEGELEKARAGATSNRIPGKTNRSINPRKRNVAHMADPDATTGTPGDLAQRSKRASSAVGEKSTFSITPFFSRTTSVPPDSELTGDEDEPMPSIEIADSPSANRSGNTQDLIKSKMSAPLAPSSLGKSNVKASRKFIGNQRKVSTISQLDKVTEEETEAEQDTRVNNVLSTVPAESTVTVPPGSASSKSKVPSLTSFASYRESSLPPQQLKRKRKLLGTAMTLFDENEEEEGPTRMNGLLGSIGGVRGQRGLGLLGGRSLAGVGLMGKQKGPIQVVEGGFVFSPLKKDRKAMAERAASAAAAASTEAVVDSSRA